MPSGAKLPAQWWWLWGRASLSSALTSIVCSASMTFIAFVAFVTFVTFVTYAGKALTCQLNTLARGQADGTVQANYFAVEHVVFKNMLGQLGVILGCAQP